MASSSSSDAQVAERYATALFELANESGQLNMAEGALTALRDTFEASPELAETLRNPAFTRADKRAVMARVAETISGAGGGWATFDGFLGALESHGRFAVLPKICEQFVQLMAEHRGEVRAQVTAAMPLSDTQINALASNIQSAVGGTVKLDITIDPSLIGGLIVRVGSKMIDSSIRSKLSNLQTVMREVG
ncbi:MAG: F0F1 ATP synthase subunit delta [Pseudomonadota bacterium]